MRIACVSNEPSFKAGFANDIVTKKVLKAVKNDAFSQPVDFDIRTAENLLQSFGKVCRGDAYRLAVENDKLVMTSVIPNKYRNTEPLKDSISESFMRLIGKFVNLKSSL